MKSEFSHRLTITLDKDSYDTRVKREKCRETVNDTLLQRLGKLSLNLDRALSAPLIGSIETGVMKNRPTRFSFANYSWHQDEEIKKLIEVLKKYGVTCTYDNVRRFKHSAAKAITTEPSLPGLSTSSSSLVQVIVDNLDTDLSSPNGKSSTHSLAMLLTQPDSTSERVQEDTVRRVKGKTWFSHSGVTS